MGILKFFGFMNTFKQNIKENKGHYIALLLICLLGFILRITNLDKSTGMWLDESNTYNIARQSFPLGIMHIIKNFEPHTPLYYFILHFWMKLFGEGDCTLRLLSVIFGTLTIFVGYLTGKELKDNFTGLVTAMLICCNSLLIYFSQEVRIYALSILLVTLSIYFLIRVNNSPTKLDHIGLVLTNTFLLYSFFTGFVIIILQAIIMSIYLYLYKRTHLKNYILSIISSFLLFLPYISTLIYQIGSSSKYTMIWYSFQPLKLLYMFHDWFSPLLILLRYVILEDYLKMLKNNYLLFCGFIPIIIYFVGIFSALIRKSFAIVPFLIGLSFLILEILAMINNKVAVEIRYTVIILPIFILVAAYGLTSLKWKYLKIILILSLFFINLFYLISSPSSELRVPRTFGYKSIATFLHNSKFGKGDMVLARMATAGYRLSSNNTNKIFLEKYIDENTQLEKINIIPLNTSYIITQNVNPNNDYQGSVFTDYKILKNYIYSPEISEFNRKYFETEIHSKLKKGHYICLALEYVDLYNSLKNNLNRDSTPGNPQLFLLSYGRINEDLLSLCNKYFKLIETKKINSWTMFVYKNE